MIQTLIMSEIIKILTLLLFKVVLVRTGFLGNKYDRGKGRLKNAINALLGNNIETTSTPISTYSKSNDRSEETTALVTGLIQLAFTALGCLIVRHTINSLTNNIRSVISDTQTQHIPSNITKYLPQNTTLTSHELELVDNGLTLPQDITFDFKHMGKLVQVKETLEEIADDFLLSNMNDTSLLQPISGFLLFGPPGCGKTALAKSFCKKLSIPMISVTPSVLLRKYIGESSQLLKALFSLSVKLSPCMIFIDEMDSMFRTRSDEDHPVFRNLETEFMQLWDQLVDQKQKVMIVAATNRPEDIDPAVKRRFERSFYIQIPDESSRIEIFKKVLQSVPIAADFNYRNCAKLTEGYSSSDIVAVCKAAMAIPIRESRKQYIKNMKEKSQQSNVTNQTHQVRHSLTGSNRIHNITATAFSSNNITNSSSTNITTINNNNNINNGTNINIIQNNVRPLRNMDIEKALKSVISTAQLNRFKSSPSSSSSSSLSPYTIDSTTASSSNNNNNNNNKDPDLSFPLDGDSSSSSSSSSNDPFHSINNFPYSSSHHNNRRNGSTGSGSNSGSSSKRHGHGHGHHSQSLSKFWSQRQKPSSTSNTAGAQNQLSSGSSSSSSSDTNNMTSSSSTNTTDGVDNADEYIVENTEEYEMEYIEDDEEDEEDDEN